MFFDSSEFKMSMSDVYIYKFKYGFIYCNFTGNTGFNLYVSLKKDVI